MVRAWSRTSFFWSTEYSGSLIYGREFFNRLKAGGPAIADNEVRVATSNNVVLKNFKVGICDSK